MLAVASVDTTRGTERDVASLVAYSSVELQFTIRSSVVAVVLTSAVVDVDDDVEQVGSHLIGRFLYFIERILYDFVRIVVEG